jgi:hypothetical protein
MMIMIATDVLGPRSDGNFHTNKIMRMCPRQNNPENHTTCSHRGAMATIAAISLSQVTHKIMKSLFFMN